ncbi:MAG TPA: zinc-ribbon domain-containing protein [Gemmatimonadaceae bacterium]|jgi:predicted Zn finger-like uncharacterized protein|nr:zinc-ribbon domain-containing protein [Gemmatimonadaceae bacterium]
MNPMVVQCLSCRTEFELDPAKIPAEGVRARCSVCSAVITVPPPPKAETPRPREEMPEWGEEGGAPAAVLVPAAAPVNTRAEVQERVPEPQVQPPPPPRFEAAPPAIEPPSSATPARGVATGIPVPADQTAVRKTSLNPFLARDPSLRAKRLARALVSDIVAYHPARHSEGLRDGTLKTLFRDEIKKSYDEYVDQVGRDFAESTMHFQDALNDVLAVGKKLF